MSCPICIESLFKDIIPAPAGDSDTLDWQDRPSVLLCGHVFHQGCISAWLFQPNRGSCPVCRKTHKGDPILLYIEADSPDSPEECADAPEIVKEVTDSQVKHRNSVIKTLCQNIEDARSEAKKARTELAEMSTRYTLQEAKLASQRSKLLESRTSIIERKKIITDLRSKEMGLEKTIAEKSLQSEEQRQRIANLSSELAEQRRVVASLGDVHTTNEQLARSLKRERTKAETQATLNANLASRVAELEKENGWLRKSTSDEPCTLTRPFQPRVSASRQAPVDDLPIVSLISDASIETHLDDDDDNDDDEPPHSTVAPLANRWTSSKPQRRPGPTFGISLKALEPSASQRADTYVGVTNPFAIANKPFESLASKDFVFTQGLAPPKPSLHSTQRSAGPLWRSKHAIASNGLGGSRQGSSIHKKGTATIQSTIGWGSKK